MTWYIEINRYRQSKRRLCKKTAIKKVLKFAPLQADALRAIASDETIKTELAVDMTEVVGERLEESEVVDVE